MTGPALEIPPELRADLEEVDAFPEVVVLIDPAPEVLEAYTIEERLGVIAVMAGTPEERAAALEAGALEVLDPRAPAEARVRLQTAVARFRSRLRLEEARDALDRQTEALERDLRLAARLQRSFLPRLTELERPGVRFASAYLPREFVSGDSYEARWLDPDHLALYTLDAVGHGVRAALLTVLLRSAFRPVDAAGALRDPGEVVAELDQVLRDADLDEAPTAAFCYALLDLPRRTLRLANAGHPLPVRLPPGGEPAALGGSDLLLGVDPERYETHEVALAPGDRVFLYSDGAEPGYLAGFVDQLARHRDLELMDQLGGALGAAITLDDEGRPEDDVTVLAIELTGS
ncbi:MAG: serine/threonine-protein phosphatase [Planctomycetes bacterium]|nr:serine/threonine-protein phosphatase [Planctomycetota bacterium]